MEYTKCRFEEQVGDDTDNKVFIDVSNRLCKRLTKFPYYRSLG